MDMAYGHPIPNRDPYNESILTNRRGAFPSTACAGTCAYAHAYKTHSLNLRFLSEYALHPFVWQVAEGGQAAQPKMPAEDIFPVLVEAEQIYRVPFHCARILALSPTVNGSVNSLSVILEL